MIEAQAPLAVGQSLRFNEIPNDEKLGVFCHVKDVDAIALELGLPTGIYCGALVETEQAAFKTVWLSVERRSYHPDASYVLVKHDGLVLSKEDLGF